MANCEGSCSGRRPWRAPFGWVLAASRLHGRARDSSLGEGLALSFRRVAGAFCLASHCIPPSLAIYFPGCYVTFMVYSSMTLNVIPLTPLESALTKIAVVSPLESTLANYLDLNSLRITLLQKSGGCPHPILFLERESLYLRPVRFGTAHAQLPLRGGSAIIKLVSHRNTRLT
jgi:hypothetical protein